jgi:hypothetical protein
VPRTKTSTQNLALNIPRLPAFKIRPKHTKWIWHRTKAQAWMNCNKTIF